VHISQVTVLGRNLTVFGRSVAIGKGRFYAKTAFFVGDWKVIAPQYLLSVMAPSRAGSLPQWISVEHKAGGSELARDSAGPDAA
jgi:hypothetical protein